MPEYLHLDFETQSEAILKDVGAHNYATHPSTRIMCAAFYWDSGYWLLPFMTGGNVSSPVLEEAAADPNVVFVAHNAGFEYSIWKEIMVAAGFPMIPADRWTCAMAMALSHGLPGSLDGALKATRAPVAKNEEGYKVMMKLSKPKRDGTFWTPSEAPDDFQKLYRYCVDDVKGEVWLHQNLRPLTSQEQKLWAIDLEMNKRGLRIDRHMVNTAIEFTEKRKAEIGINLQHLTEGTVDAPTKRKQFTDWAANQGLILPNTQKATIAKVLKRTDLPVHVTEAVKLFAEGNKTSLAKYPAMLLRADRDDIIREILQFHGAHTGRWAGRGVQFQNLKRVGDLDLLVLRFAMEHCGYETFAMLYPEVSDILSRGVRGTVIARPGKKLYGADYGQIESRGNAWLAGQEDKLEKFRQGLDMYCVIAEPIFGRPIDRNRDRNERQTGKVADLALGYGGGIAAFANMARGYGLSLATVAEDLWRSASSDERRKAEYCLELYRQGDHEEPLPDQEALAADIIKQRWRKAHPKIAGYKIGDRWFNGLWQNLEEAAIRAVQTKQVIPCGKVRFFMHDRFLWCVLPSGRPIAYPYPKVTSDARGRVKLTYMTEFENKWIRIGTYGGSLCENLVQAIARDLLAYVIIESNETYPVLFHVHDELIAEVDDGYGSKEDFANVMRRQPRWSEGLPIAVDPWEGYRYGVKG